MKKIHIVITAVLIASVSFLTGCLGETGKAIAVVKNGCFNEHPEKTVGNAVKDFFASPKWEAGYPLDEEYEGYMLVNCTGGIIYDGKPVEALIQFVVDTKEDEFLLNAFEIEGEAMSDYMITQLINAMFEE